jgi:hypothetical protein
MLEATLRHRTDEQPMRRSRKVVVVLLCDRFRYAQVVGHELEWAKNLLYVQSRDCAAPESISGFMYITSRIQYPLGQKCTEHFLDVGEVNQRRIL